MQKQDTRYLDPHEAGLASEARAVGRRAAAVLNALGDLNANLASGTLIDECFRLKGEMIRRLEEDGWRVSIPGNSYRVLPPLRERGK